jgi:short-subunit dehydrogenase
MSDQIICITGGSNGLGRELAASLSSKNKVIIFDIDQKLTKTIAEKFNCDFHLCDITDFDSLQNSINEVISKYDQIDCFINNAGIYIDGPIQDNNPQKIKKVIEVNTIAPMYIAHILVPLFKKQKQGTLINISSTAALHPKANNSVYHASKWGLNGFSQSLQLELASSNIRIIDICPGLMKTKFTDGTDTDLSHAIDPEEIVKTINFILSLKSHVTIPQLTIKHL